MDSKLAERLLFVVSIAGGLAIGEPGFMPPGVFRTCGWAGIRQCAAAQKAYRVADNVSFSLEMAKLFVAGKIVNSKTVLQRAIRDHVERVNAIVLQEAITKLSHKQKQVMKASHANELRDYEGESAMTYFSVFHHLILHLKN